MNLSFSRNWKTKRIVADTTLSIVYGFDNELDKAIKYVSKILDMKFKFISSHRYLDLHFYRVNIEENEDHDNSYEFDTEPDAAANLLIINQLNEPIYIYLSGNEQL